MKKVSHILLSLCLVSSTLSKTIQQPVYIGYQDSLGQYSFGYSAPGSARSEIRQSDGQTRGSYSYVDDNGVIQSAEYTADAENGFRISATNLPQQVEDTPEVKAARAAHLEALRLVYEREEQRQYKLGQGSGQLRSGQGLGQPGFGQGSGQLGSGQASEQLGSGQGSGQLGSGHEPRVRQPEFGQPEFGQPGFGQPGLGQSAFEQSGISQPGFGQQGSAQGSDQPGSEQGSVQLGSGQGSERPGSGQGLEQFGSGHEPRVRQPGFGLPGIVQSGFGQPGFVQPRFVQLGSGQEPGVGQPGFGQPGLGQSGFEQSGISQPGFGQQGSAQGSDQPGSEQGSVQLGSGQGSERPGSGQRLEQFGSRQGSEQLGSQQGSEPGFGQPGIEQSGIGQPGFGEPGISQPEFGLPGIEQPVFTQPGFGQPGVGQPGLGQPGVEQGQDQFRGNVVVEAKIGKAEAAKQNQIVNSTRPKQIVGHVHTNIVSEVPEALQSPEVDAARRTYIQAIAAARAKAAGAKINYVVNDVITRVSSSLGPVVQTSVTDESRVVMHNQPQTKNSQHQGQVSLPLESFLKTQGVSQSSGIAPSTPLIMKNETYPSEGFMGQTDLKDTQSPPVAGAQLHRLAVPSHISKPLVVPSTYAPIKYSSDMSTPLQQPSFAVQCFITRADQLGNLVDVN